MVLTSLPYFCLSTLPRDLLMRPVAFFQLVGFLAIISPNSIQQDTMSTESHFDAVQPHGHRQEGEYHCYYLGDSILSIMHDIFFRNLVVTSHDSELCTSHAINRFHINSLILRCNSGEYSVVYLQPSRIQTYLTRRIIL